MKSSDYRWVNDTDKWVAVGGMESEDGDFSHRKTPIARMDDYAFFWEVTQNFCDLCGEDTSDRRLDLCWPIYNPLFALRPNYAKLCSYPSATPLCVVDGEKAIRYFNSAAFSAPIVYDGDYASVIYNQVGIDKSALPGICNARVVTLQQVKDLNDWLYDFRAAELVDHTYLRASEPETDGIHQWGAITATPSEEQEEEGIAGGHLVETYAEDSLGIDDYLLAQNVVIHLRRQGGVASWVEETAWAGLLLSMQCRLWVNPKDGSGTYTKHGYMYIPVRMTRSGDTWSWSAAPTDAVMTQAYVAVGGDVSDYSVKQLTVDFNGIAAVVVFSPKAVIPQKFNEAEVTA